ncbi:uncharacterized protein LOC144179875 [Haemaphysalis longicornis]
MADTPQAQMRAAKKVSNLAVNPRYTVTAHGFMNIIETGAAITSLVAVLLSTDDGTSSKLMLVVAFAYGYTSLVMLMGGIISPYTQAYLPLSLYSLLYHLVGSGFLLITGGWLMGAAKGGFLMQLAAGSGVGCGVVHFFHGLYTFVTVFNKPE